MTGLFKEYETVLGRMDQLTANSQRLWGTMSVEAMLAHHIDALEVVMKVKPSAYPEGKEAKFFANPIGRWMIIYAPMPWPKGKVQGPPSFLTSAPVEFEAGRARVKALVNAFVQAGPDADFGASPFLGKLKPKQWSDLLLRHFNHHFEQFGV